MVPEEKAIFVVGDIMLDTYWNGRVSRISPEAPIQVLNHTDTTDGLGGAANVARNLAHADFHVRLFGIIGDDAAGAAVRRLTEKAGIGNDLVQDENERTIQKLRVASNGHQIVRVDFESQFTAPSAQKISNQAISELDNCSLLILSDYAKGTLANVKKLIEAANRRQIKVLVDPKGDSFDKYCNATVLKPNKVEFELIVGNCDSYAEMVSKGEILRDKLNLKALLLTLSEEGMLLLEKGKDPLVVPVIKRDIADVTGAGDTVIAWLARGLVSGKNLSESVIRSNVASSIAVSKLGTSAVSLSEVMAYERSNLSNSTPLGLSEYVALCKSAGETIVFTNGCFDILHEGHVKYLQEAKALGHRLIVGVNDDASVRLLKGDSRPINSVSSRIKILNALSSTDFVVAFSAETPIDLITEVSPDILVKGGDYQDKLIVGSDYVIERGGTVQTIDFLEGFSTSNIIDAMKLSHS